MTPNPKKRIFRAPVGTNYYAYRALVGTPAHPISNLEELLGLSPHRDGSVAHECVYTKSDVLYLNDEWAAFRLPHYANDDTEMVVVLYWRLGLEEAEV